MKKILLVLLAVATLHAGSIDTCNFAFKTATDHYLKTVDYSDIKMDRMALEEWKLFKYFAVQANAACRNMDADLTKEGEKILKTRRTVLKQWMKILKEKETTFRVKL